MTRVAIVGGYRTPFVKAGTAYKDESAFDLASFIVEETVRKLDLDTNLVDELVFGSVLLNPRIPNLAREIVLRTSLPKSLSAHFVSNNCITGLVAAACIADAIKSQRINVGLAGGVESMSQPTLTLSKAAEKFYLNLNYTRSLGKKLSSLTSLRPSFFFPEKPSPKEPSTGLTMGEHCELTAKEFKISREAQDQFALESHQNAHAAWEAGHFSETVLPYGGAEKDNIVRASTSIDKLAKLRPAFDKEQGTITAGNSSSLTDGASCLCLMSEDKARELNREVIGYIDSIEFAGIDPQDGLLMGPALALTKLFEKNNLTVDEIDRFEIHEAFAAQVLSNLHAWEHGWDKYPNLQAIGKIPTEKINVNGGSLAIGHPFAATGGRLIVSLVNELRRNNLSTGVISVCAAGAMAGAVLVRVK